MPKAYSEKESKYIQDKLMQVAADCMGKYGIRKTTVDNMVKLANIPKGTFYLFWDSKEELLYNVFLKAQREIHEFLLKKIGENTVTAEYLTELMLSVMLSDRYTFIFNIFRTKEYEIFLQKLPENILNENDQNDLNFLEEIIKRINHMSSDSIQYYVKALQLAFVNDYGSECENIETYKNVLKIVLKGIFLQLLEEKQ